MSILLEGNFTKYHRY